MNDAITLYIDQAFHPDLGSLLHEALGLFEAFGLELQEARFIDLLMNEEVLTDDALQDGFITLVHQGLGEILQAHRITLQEHDVELWDKLQLLKALYQVQDLSDYAELLPILESELSPLEKLGELAAQQSLLRPTDLDRIIAEFDPLILDQLKAMIYHRTQTQEALENRYTDTQRAIIENLRAFKRFCLHRSEGYLPMGLQMAETYVLIGRPFRAYLSYLQEAFHELNLELLAFNLLSVLLLSEDGYQHPLSVYREHSERLLDDLPTITKVDVHLLNLAQQFDRFKLTPPPLEIPA
jgi:hypothetical protein